MSPSYFFGTLFLTLWFVTAPAALSSTARGNSSLPGHGPAPSRQRAASYRLRKLALAADDHEISEALTRLHFAEEIGTADEFLAARADVRAVVYRRLTEHMEILNYMLDQFTSGYQPGGKEVSGPPTVLLSLLSRGKVLIELYPVGIAQGLSPPQAEEACEPSARRVAGAIAGCGRARVGWATFAAFEQWVEGQI